MWVVIAKGIILVSVFKCSVRFLLWPPELWPPLRSTQYDPGDSGRLGIYARAEIDKTSCGSTPDRVAVFSSSSSCKDGTYASLVFTRHLFNIAERNRFGSIRFGSVIFENSSVRFGTVRNLCFPVWRGSACTSRMRRGSVRFGSVPRPVPVPAGSEITRFGSVRFGRFGSVSYSFLINRDRHHIVLFRTERLFSHLPLCKILCTLFVAVAH